MSLPARVATLIVAFLAVAAVVAFVVVKYFLTSSGPPVEDFTAHVTPDTGAAVNVVMQEAPQTTVTTDPDWVTYFIQNPQTHAWVHTTNFSVPAGSKINITIYGYDGCTPLRNQLWGQVTGTIGNSMTVTASRHRCSTPGASAQSRTRSRFRPLASTSPWPRRRRSRRTPICAAPRRAP